MIDSNYISKEMFLSEIMLINIHWILQENYK